MPTKFTKSSFPQTLSRKGVLVPHLDDYDKWDQPWEFKYEPKEHDLAWHPSGDCLPSANSLFDQKLKEEHRLISPSLQRTFLVGHFWHQVIQRVVIDLGYAAPEDIECTGTKVWSTSLEPEPYRWVRGQADILLTMPRWNGICDIKTMNNADWLECERTGLLPPRFADKYEAQINIYMDLFNQERGLIVGVNKDSSKFIEFSFVRNQPLIDAIYEKWVYVGDCLASNTNPDEDLAPLTFQGPGG